MSKVDSVTDLPKWFKLHNYDCFNDLSSDHLIEQLDVRLYIFDRLENPDQIDGINSQFCFVPKIYSEIQQSNPIIKNTPMVNKSSNSLLKIFSASSKAIKGITNSNIYSCHKLLEKNSELWHEKMLKKEDWYKRGIETDNIQDKNSNFFKHFSRNMIDFSLFIQEIEHDSTDIFIKINLAEHTDKEIQSNLSKLLPVWRQQFKLPEPKDIVLSKPSDIKKILEYRIIPLLDLRIWSSIEKKLSLIGSIPQPFFHMEKKEKRSLSKQSYLLSVEFQ